MQYIGEHLAIGNLGHLSIVLAFTLSILSSISYFFATQKGEEDNSWLKIARVSFLIQCVAVVTVFVSLFYIIYHHYYEYHYAWEHSSNVLPTKFMISCFWEGQEGSFLLWIIWQALLGALVMWKAPKSWEKPVMAVIAASQVMLTSMILGVVIGDIKLGSSPFTLLRDAMTDAPIFQQAGYLSMIKDGNGLNPLLQNNWMVIHPPTLFFGFASTLVPFAFAIAGLWQKRYTEWIKPALPWALVCLCVLGVGIVMGAAWAYESLSFGGYWNWDPVENASILPWLIIAAAIHAMVIFNSTKKSAHASAFLAILAFLSVLYATFLTRSGILGDSSVHSFTDLGLSGQLLIWLFFFIIGSTILLVQTWNKYTSNKDADSLSAREFWMFIGALVLLLSSIHIVTVTSIPVYNKIASLFNVDLKMAPPSDVIQAYHFIQIPIAILITLGSAFAQYLKYRNTQSLKSFAIKMLVYFVISLAIGGTLFLYAELGKVIYGILLVTSIFALLTNTAYIFDVLRGNMKAAGASISHLGFAMMLIGIIFSSVNKTIISNNNSGFTLGDAKADAENILLEKNQPMRMKSYIVTYLGDSSVAPNIFHKVHYKKVDDKDQVLEEFTLIPNTQINPKMGNVANPDTKHYVDHDVFTHVTSGPKNENPEDDTVSLKDVKSFWVSPGDTLHSKYAMLVFDSTENLTESEKNTNGADILIGARFTVYTNGGEIFNVEPMFGVKGNSAVYFEGRCKEAGVVAGFLNVNPDNHKIQIAIGERAPERDFIIMKAIIFPYINLLWAGTILLSLGTFMAFVRRMKLAKNEI